MSKYTFNGETLAKSRLVLAVVKDYVSKNPNTSFDDLKKHFQMSGKQVELNQAIERFLSDSLKLKSSQKIKATESTLLKKVKLFSCRMKL